MEKINCSKLLGYPEQKIVYRDQTRCGINLNLNEVKRWPLFYLSFSLSLARRMASALCFMWTSLCRFFSCSISHRLFLSSSLILRSLCRSRSLSLSSCNKYKIK